MRAVTRWVWRMFRREWRQQLLVLVLLTVSVAGAIFAASAAYSATPIREGEFGSANFRLTYDGGDARQRAADIATARSWFGTVDPVTHITVPVPGSVDTLDVRAQDPRGPYSKPMLRLLRGRYPTADGEVAVTEGVASDYKTSVGTVLDLGRHRRSVVGIVENPSDLNDEFALVAPADSQTPDALTLLVKTTDARLQAFHPPSGRPQGISTRDDERAVAAVLTLALATVVLLLVCLVAAAGFVALAHRRLRQLGMLAAAGATERQLRLVVLVNGLAVGAVAAVVGTTLGLAARIAAVPLLERAAAHRIGRFDVRWWLVVAGMALAVVTATVAAWWPARAVARIPITQALSARPPASRPAHRSAVAAVVLLGTGFAGLVTGIDVAHDNVNAPLLLGGMVAIVVGVLFASPLALRVLAAVATRAPVSIRLALRDLARHQARSGAALAAISLALGLSVGVVVIATAARHTASEGNLPDRQLLVGIGNPRALLVPDRTPGENAELDARAARLARALGQVTVVPLDRLVDPRVPVLPPIEGGPAGRPAVEIGFPVGPHTVRGGPTPYLATPELLRVLGLDAADFGTHEVLSSMPSDRAEYVNVPGRRELPAAVKTVDLSYTSAPRSLISPAAAAAHRWTPARVGWLVLSDTPFTRAQVAAARDVAAGSGLTVESRNHQQSLLALRSGATAVGMLFALAILAMTVGLIRGEAARDLRTLTAAGATSAIRRTLTAATSGGLALLGALLGTAGAYLALVAGYRTQLSSLRAVPVVQLLVTIVGVPLIAWVAGWLVGGREPPAIARSPIE